MQSTTRWGCLLALLLVLPPATGTEADAVESVEIAGIRDPDAFDLAKGIALRHRFESIPPEDRNQVRLAFYVQALKGHALPPRLRLSLAIGDERQPLKLLDSGELVLPPLDPADAAQGQVMTNARRGTVRIVYYVQPVISGPVTLGYLRASLVQARAAWKVLYGPVLGLTVPRFTCAEAHYRQPLSPVTLVRDDGTMAWKAEAAPLVRIPTSDISLADSWLIDWGTSVPFRLGGCVENTRQDNA